MSIFILILMLAINLFISCWDAFVAGVIWREATGWMNWVKVSAVGMSLCGFFMIFTFLGGYGALMFHYLKPQTFDILLKLNYLLIIFPILGFGLIITIYSWITAWKERRFADVAVAGWNTFAIIHDTTDAIQNTGGFFDEVTSFFSSDSDDEEKGTSIIGLILVIAAGFAVGSTYYFWWLGRRFSLSSRHQENETLVDASTGYKRS